MTIETSPPVPAGALRRLYSWVMRMAAGPHRWWVLGAVSFAESSFFPLPPDLFLIPMVLADRKNAFWLATWCTLASVLGGLLGYAIGALLMDTLGQWLINVYHLADKKEAFQQGFAEYGAWIILLKGLTPIPYKLVTIVSGMAGYSLPLFIILSIITRGLRFSIVAGLLYAFGEPMRHFIEKRLEWVMLAVFAAIVAGFVIIAFV
jgi:membrane protein YqaA with SNARE-associated domain